MCLWDLGKKEKGGGGEPRKKEKERKIHVCLEKKGIEMSGLGSFFKAPMTGSGHRVDKGDMLEDKGWKSSPVL